MRYIFLGLASFVVFLMIIVFFQNLVGAMPADIYILTLAFNMNPAWLAVYSYVVGIVTALLFFMFLNAGASFIPGSSSNQEKQSKDEEEW